MITAPAGCEICLLWLIKCQTLSFIHKKELWGICWAISFLYTILWMCSGSFEHDSDTNISKYCSRFQLIGSRGRSTRQHTWVNKDKKRTLTSLTVFLSPAALAEVAVDGGGLAGGLSHRRSGTHVSALPVVFVGHDVVVLHRVEDFRPVQSGEVA